MMSTSPPESLFVSFLRPTSAACHRQLHYSFSCPLGPKLSPFSNLLSVSNQISSSHGLVVAAAGSILTATPRNGVYTVGDFMTKKEDLHVVKPTTTVNEALEILVENRIAGFPVIDDEWKLVLEDPIQTCFLKLTALGKLLLKTKYRRLPVVDADGKLVGIITRGNVVRAALQVKQDEEKS